MSCEEGAFIVIAYVRKFRSAVEMEDVSYLFLFLLSVTVILALDTFLFQFSVEWFRHDLQEIIGGSHDERRRKVLRYLLADNADIFTPPFYHLCR